MSRSAAERGASVRRALSLSVVQTLVALVFSFGAVIIISHLLTPAEIGVYSVAAGLIALIQMLRDFGVSEFLIQEKELERSLIRTVFTINLAIAWLLGAALFALSGVAGQFYGNPGVTQVLRVLSLVLIVLPFGAVTQTLLKRNLEFGKFAKISLSSSISRSCAAVGLAYAGFTYMSMAWAALIGTVVMVAGCALWGWRYRVTGLGLRGWRRVLRFGSNRTVSDIASQLGDQSANLVIGRMLGMTDTGLYSRGYGIVNMFRSNIIAAINAVAFPAFAREHREAGTAPQLFLKSLVYLTGVSWPFFAAGILLAFPIIRILFGDQWDAAVPLMRWLCAAAIVGTLTYQCSQFLVALGRVRSVTRVELKYQFARVALTIAAAFVSVIAVAAVQILVYVIATALYYRKLREYEALTLSHCAHALMPSVWVTLATCLGPAIVVLWPGLVRDHMLIAMLAAVPTGCIGWLVAVVLVHHPLVQELHHAWSRLRAYSHSIGT